MGTVYVDALFFWPVEQTRGWRAKRVAKKHGGRWCHLWADDVETLHAFADKIGMMRAWFQDRPGFPHYDLVAKRRALAVKLGAVEVADLGAWRRERGLK